MEIVAKVGSCSFAEGKQSVYAGDTKCNKVLLRSLDHYKYRLLTISSSFDADYYHVNKEPRMTAQLNTVALENGASVAQKVTASTKLIQFRDSIFNPMKIEKILTGDLKQSYPINQGTNNYNHHAMIILSADVYA